MPFLDSTAIMELGEVPERLLVMGGGYVGLEFGQMFSRFGSDVTIIQRSAQLLTREDADVAEVMACLLEEEGIEVHLRADVRSVAETPEGDIELTLDGGSQVPEAVAGSHLLVATGRAPNTEALRVEAAGVETDKRGHVKVNDRLETSTPGIYALGDVTGGAAFTQLNPFAPIDRGAEGAMARALTPGRSETRA